MHGDDNDGMRLGPGRNSALSELMQMQAAPDCQCVISCGNESANEHAVTEQYILEQREGRPADGRSKLE